MYQKIYIHIVISVCILISLDSLHAQPEIVLPSEINILVNDAVFEPSETWTDSLINEAANGFLRYEIATTMRNSGHIITKIRVPQVFDVPQVIRQVVMYYGLLGDEKTKKKEKLHIYPFFSKLGNAPYLECSYIRNGWLQFEVSSWPAVEIPAAPSPEEKFLYNQLLEASASEFGDYDGLTEEIFNTVAEQNNVTVEELTFLYQNVKLWHLSR